MIYESLLEGGSVCLSLYLSFEKCHFLTWTHLFFHAVEGRSWVALGRGEQVVEDQRQ
jgi:hypothetical protein